MLKHLSKEARSKEFRRQEEELTLDTLVAETSTDLHEHIENELNQTKIKKGKAKSHGRLFVAAPLCGCGGLDLVKAK